MFIGNVIQRRTPHNYTPTTIHTLAYFLSYLFILHEAMQGQNIGTSTKKSIWGSGALSG